jgi:putative PIN family toxin of toxin-antitoxin system
MTSFRLVVIFDTSVLLPAILPASQSRRLLRKVQELGGAVAISPQISSEVAAHLKHDRRLREWLGVTEEQIDRFLRFLGTQCLQLRGTRQAHGAVPADPDDDKIVAAAIEAGASYIVTEDRHLLDLHQTHGIAIVNRLQFENWLLRSKVA